MSTKPKQDLYLSVMETREHGYFHLHARVATAKYDGGARLPYGVDDDYSDGLKYTGLRFSCQGDASTQRAERRETAVYGWDSVEYHDVWRLDLRQCSRMVKTIQLIDRKLAKLSETRGYARSYGEYLGRVAEALGCQGMAFQQSPKRAQMSGQAWRWTSIGDGVNEANNAIYQWQREAQERAEQEVAS